MSPQNNKPWLWIQEGWFTSITLFPLQTGWLQPNCLQAAALCQGTIWDNAGWGVPKPWRWSSGMDGVGAGLVPCLVSQSGSDPSDRALAGMWITVVDSMHDGDVWYLPMSLQPDGTELSLRTLEVKGMWQNGFGSLVAGSWGPKGLRFLTHCDR